VTRPLALAVPVSLALHLATALLALSLVPRHDAAPALFIDLTLAHEPQAPRVAPPPSVRPPRPRDLPSGRVLERVASSTPATVTARAPAPMPLAAQAPTSSLSAADQRDAARRPESSAPSGGPALAGTSEPMAEPSTSSGPSRDGRAAAIAESRVDMTPAGRTDAAVTVASARSADGPGAALGSADATPRLPAAGEGTGGGRGRSGATGAADTTAGGGGGTGAVSALAGAPGTDTPAAEYGPYLAAIRRQIAESLRYPSSARRRHLTGTVHLEIVIGADGAIAAADVVASSAHAVLDAAAVETVRSLRPVPFPRNVPARILKVRLPVVFTLE
jgi:periplasmic protein TonB